MHKAWKPWEHLSLQAAELCVMSQLLCPQSSAAPVQSHVLQCPAVLSRTCHGTWQHSTDTGMCSHTAHTLQCYLRNTGKASAFHLSVVCLLHTDFLTHFDFQGKFIRTNLICFFPLTTKGVKSFYKFFLSLFPSMFYDCNNCKI